MQIIRIKMCVAGFMFFFINHLAYASYKEDAFKVVKDSIDNKDFIESKQTLEYEYKDSKIFKIAMSSQDKYRQYENSKDKTHKDSITTQVIESKKVNLADSKNTNKDFIESQQDIDSIKSLESKPTNSKNSNKNSTDFNLTKATKQSFPLKKRSEKEVRDMLQMLPNEHRAYIMRFAIDGNIYDAYVGIGNLSGGDSSVFIGVHSLNHSTEETILDIDECEMGLESGRLVIKGIWRDITDLQDSKFSGMEFLANVCDTCNLYEVDFISGSFEMDKKTKNGIISYSKKLSLPFIPENNKILNHARERINAALHSLGDKQTISRRLAKQARNSIIDKDGMLLGLDFNVEYNNSVSLGHVSKELLMLVENYYIYEGGAHGNTFLNIRAFSLHSGEELPTKIEDIFDMQKQDEILALLTKKLQPQAEGLYSLPLKDLPDIFLFDNTGMILIWQLYSIAPYSSGFINVHVDFDEIAPFVKKDSVYKFLFQKNEL